MNIQIEMLYNQIEIVAYYFINNKFNNYTLHTYIATVLLCAEGKAMLHMTHSNIHINWWI